jgi:hypothetical protein
LDDIVFAVHGGAAGFDVDGGCFLVLKGGKAVEGDDVFADAAGLLNTQFGAMYLIATCAKFSSAEG